MSRNSKNARLTAERKQNRRAQGVGNPTSTGNKGPARTEPKHGKKRAWFQLYDTYGDFLKAQKGGERRKRQEQAQDERADAVEDKAA
jgi:hypothetical protein